MKPDRRQFMAGTGALAAGGLAERERCAPGSRATLDWGAIRALFPLDRRRIHLAGMLLTSHPAPVADAIEAARAALDADPAGTYLAHAAPGEARARAAAARYLGTDPAQIALTDSTTMALAILYGGLRLRTGQEVLTTAHDHPSTHAALRLRAERTGVAVRRVSLYDRPAEATDEEIVDRLLAGVAPATRLVALTWVHSGTGVKLPVRGIADRLARVNRGRAEADRVLLAVDGVHGFGVEAETAGELGCDFFAAGCHKWLFGPRGTGILWARAAVAEEVGPLIPSFGGRSWGERLTPGGFHSFEHRWALNRAFELHLEIGKARVAERVHALARRLKDGLAGVDGVTLHTPMADRLSAAIVCFDVPGVPAAEVVRRLALEGIVASATPYAVSHARLSPGLWNTPAEIDAAVAAVRGIATV